MFALVPRGVATDDYGGSRAAIVIKLIGRGETRPTRSLRAKCIVAGQSIVTRLVVWQSFKEIW